MAKRDPNGTTYLSGWTEINRQFFSSCVEAARQCAAGTADLDVIGRQQMGAARSAVNETLELEKAMLADWKKQIPKAQGASVAPEIALTAMESAVELRARMWETWFDTVNRADVQKTVGKLFRNPDVLMSIWQIPGLSAKPTSSATTEPAAEGESSAET